MTAYQPGDRQCVLGVGLRAEPSSLTALQKSADGIVGPAQARLVRHPKADRRGNGEAKPQRGWAEGLNGGRGVENLGWSGAMVSGRGGGSATQASGMNSPAGAPGADAPVRGMYPPDFNLPNRRISDPYVRLCGRGEAGEAPPLSRLGFIHMASKMWVYRQCRG